MSFPQIFKSISPIFLPSSLHTENIKPAILADGSKFWYRDGRLHREGGPAVERANGDKAWYHNGQCHREDGPAVEYANGDKAWYYKGQLHREDGPAIEFASGYKEWHRNDKKISQPTRHGMGLLALKRTARQMYL
jgi:hypothetical protein